MAVSAQLPQGRGDCSWVESHEAIVEGRRPSTARVRAAATNARYETMVAQVRGRSEELLSSPDGTGWARTPETALDRLRATLEQSGAAQRSDFTRLIYPAFASTLPLKERMKVNRRYRLRC